jgi:hypothetical protein
MTAGKAKNLRGMKDRVPIPGGDSGTRRTIEEAVRIREQTTVAKLKKSPPSLRDLSSGPLGRFGIGAAVKRGAKSENR